MYQVHEFNEMVLWGGPHKAQRSWPKICVNLSELSHSSGEFLSSYPIAGVSSILQPVLVHVNLLAKKETLL